MLTEKQEAVFKFIEEYQLEHGCSPTLREMRVSFQVNSDNSILKHLKALEEKGYIQKDDTPRGIKILPSIKEKLEMKLCRIPLLGFVPAGGPVETEEYVEDYLTVGEDFAKHPDECFFLRVKGDSMIDAGIYDGDLVLADSKNQVRSGDIVIALIDGANTVKRYSIEKGKKFLKPENKKYSNIYPVEELTIQGVVVGLMRSY
ncbi:transcriptional repressor LexA [Candidatus Peregrinibacteria bacterium]|nr:transcriptional repressor LexA [Candidatus Peregrinibacteria bacterium]